MKKYYKLLVLPAIIIIIAGFFSGFSEQSCSQISESLLKERTKVLQDAYQGRLETEQAEQQLTRIETYPLLSEDIASLRQFDATELDLVKSMELVDIKQISQQFHYVSLSMRIRWHMSGYDSDYILDNEYSVILESTKEGYKLAEFNLKEE